MKIVVTGADGFLGWHTRVRLRTLTDHEVVPIGREEFADEAKLSAALANADAVIHIAGVNRAETDAEVEQGNIDIAQRLAEALVGAARPVDVSYANSIQSAVDNPYGRGKAQAAQILATSVTAAGGQFSGVLLPNLFGEHGRPGYNSFVATFADRVARGRETKIIEDREVPLLHVQSAAAALIEPITAGRAGIHPPEGEMHKVSDVMERLKTIHELYSHGEIPPLTTAFEVDLFNTYRACTFPDGFPMSPHIHSDPRGSLFETVRAHGGTGQAFVSTTTPGATRGDHYHFSKIERFFVVKGEAQIELRRLLHDEVISFRLSGDKPSFVDMPTFWVHNITNVGDAELVTMFWADQLLDQDNPDQYPELVRPREEKP